MPSSRLVVTSPGSTRAFALCLFLGLAESAAGAPCGLDSATAAFVEPGAFRVGVRTITFEDATRVTPAHGSVPRRAGRTLVTEVWYPTTAGSGTPERDAPVAPGRFPLVIDAHGMSDVREGRAYYATALASRGYVVAAPDFPVTNGRAAEPAALDTPNQPADVSFVISALLDLAADEGSWLTGRLARRRIGVVGYSNGGSTALLAAFHPTLRDRRVRAVASVAGATCYLGPSFFDHAKPDLLLIDGGADTLAGSSRHVFEAAHARRTRVELAAASHAGFSGAIEFPSTSNYDTLACGFLATLPLSRLIIDFELLGGVAAGMNASACSLPCTAPIPVGVPMQAHRQHDLTTAAITAFFDARLKRRHVARCFLARQLRRENPDVSVQHAKGTRLPRR